MQASPAAVERGARTILVAHWLERIGDRVTNIARTWSTSRRAGAEESVAAL